jgi:hypothetical protein
MYSILYAFGIVVADLVKSLADLKPRFCFVGII